MFKFLRLLGNRGANETTPTTVDEMIPVIVESALLELDDGDILRPLVKNVPFPGAHGHTDTNLPCPLGYRYQHNVHDADSTHQQADPGYGG